MTDNEDARFLLSRKLLNTFEVATTPLPNGKWSGYVEIMGVLVYANSEVDAHVAAHSMAFYEIANDLECQLQEPMDEPPIVHQGLGHARVPYNPKERAFAKAWEQENEPHSHILQSMLSHMPTPLGRVVTPRDAQIAATVIQWLGSPIGSHFLASVQGQIAAQADDLEAKQLVEDAIRKGLSEAAKNAKVVLVSAKGLESFDGYDPSMDMPDMIQFLGHELVRVPYEGEDLYGICYKNKIMEVVSRGDMDFANYWSAEMTFQGKTLRALGGSLALVEESIRQQMESK